MAIRTDQLLCIAKATGSKIHTRELEAETIGRLRTVVLSLKQYHTQYYCFYEKGKMKAMIGLQRLHTSDAFQYSNMSSSVGLKLFCPWCFKLGGNMETIATHLREVHYRLDIACDICMPACWHRSCQSAIQDVRSRHTRRSPRPKIKKKPNISLGGTNKSCLVGRCLRPFIQFHWWMWAVLVILSGFLLSHTNSHTWFLTNTYTVPWCSNLAFPYVFFESIKMQ